MRHFTVIFVDFFQSAVAAVQFLTRIPVPVQVPFEEKVLRRSIVFFPAAGLLVGLSLWVSGYLLSAALPSVAAAALLTAVWAGVTGGLHLDGLMDTADGVLSHRSRERMLEIMKDSRTGAMGVMACVLQLLCKYGLLFALLDAAAAAGWKGAAGLLLAVPIWSRWFMAVAVAMWPYAGISKDLGALFRGAEGRHVAASTLLALLLSVPGLIWSSAGGMASGLLLALAAALLAAGLGAAVACRLARRLGGLTGDTYGALNELVETVLLLAAVFYLVHGAGSFPG